ncbi:MAG: hypothetical protein R3F30_12260 [Planctomycetota bacterium]
MRACVAGWACIACLFHFLQTFGTAGSRARGWVVLLTSLLVATPLLVLLVAVVRMILAGTW